ncbi:TnsA-like heteromeric transposase endonuclease subunit [Streptomyces silvensis]|uniref:Transposase n=1 Tax=Streptomyces silvensis TaxID=1765722 RepID=A0A0W7WZ08_9ACTN|nr:TnsA-like heteromeric transposase endonuclease subunit [Streptomyces silvensis]KUF15776.1 transposase [Streptomyces silvensis]
MTTAAALEPVLVSLRGAGGDVSEDCDWASVPLNALAAASPYRTFRWYLGQRHYSGLYWSATMGDHVVYESRLELSRLLLADFDSRVMGIVAQPFLLSTRIEGKRRRHIPDYLLVTDNGPVVVDVKPRHRLEDPRVALAFAWTRRAVEARGWAYEVFSEPPSAELENVRFLAGYRRSGLFDHDLVDEVAGQVADGMPLGDCFLVLPDRPRPLVKSAVLHLLWAGRLACDLSRPLSPGHAIRRAG